LDESCLKGNKIFTTQTFTQIAEILPRPKSSFRMTKQDNCPNPILTQAAGILPRPKARSE